MQLNTLKNPAKKNRKRVGRGIAAGQGKTCGRGHKGQKSRSGKKIRAVFEGGQTPLFMKLPRIRGFKNPNRKEFQVVNVGDLEKVGTTEINLETLVSAGLIKRNLPVKILGTGDVKGKLNVTVDAASEEAKQKIEKAGGKITVTMEKAEVKEAPKKKEGKEEVPKSEEAEAPEAEANEEKE
jgi:large subunit ribosomal protein L15